MAVASVATLSVVALATLLLLKGRPAPGLLAGFGGAALFSSLAMSIVVLELQRMERPGITPKNEERIRDLAAKHRLSDVETQVALWSYKGLCRVTDPLLIKDRWDTIDQFMKASGRTPDEISSFCGAMKAVIEAQPTGNWVEVQHYAQIEIPEGEEKNLEVNDYFKVGKLSGYLPKEVGTYRLKDAATGDEYLFESKWLVRYKCYLLTFASPVVQLAGGVASMAWSVVKIGTGMPFWSSGEGVHGMKMEALRLVSAPLVYLGLELAALYGLFRPYDGRKFYASLERFLYGGAFLAPCFQPDPTHHLFGSDINDSEGM